MRLRLSLVNWSPGVHDHADTCDFTQNGGTIGRSCDCDWMLPDPSNAISRCHAEIQYANGSFLIVDQSSNGVYLDDAEAPIGKGRASPLAHGNRLRIGNFEILVAIDSLPPPTAPLPEPVDPAPVIPWDFPFDRDSEVDAGVPPPDHEVIGEPLPRGAVVPPLLPTASGKNPSNAATQAPGPTVDAPEPEPPGDPVHCGEEHAAPPPPPADGLETALAALLAGAGVADLEVPGGATPELFRLIGEILAIYARGSVELVNAISLIKNSYRIEQSVIRSASDNNPLRWVTPSAAVERLLVSNQRDYMPPAAAVADTMNSVIAHQLGVLKAMEAAFQSFVRDELAPESLKRHFDAQGKPGPLANKNAWYWEQYAQHHREIAAMAEKRYLDLLGAPFREEYERQVRPIRAQAKGTGSD